jgi:nitroreductase
MIAADFDASCGTDEPSLPVPGSVDLFEAMGSLVAMRWYTEEPVPEHMIRTVLWAATRAPSPGNSQGWDFLVVTDPELRRGVADAIRPLYEHLRSLPEPPPESRRLRRGSLNLLANLDRVPVLVFVCGRMIYPPAEPRLDMMYSALYGATQNLMLAARALGLGTVMTTFHSAYEAQIRPLLGIPDDVHVSAMIPLGWPARQPVPVRRKPLSEVVHRNSW